MAEETDWPEIAGLYALLGQMAPNPMVTLNHAVAVRWSGAAGGVGDAGGVGG